MTYRSLGPAVGPDLTNVDDVAKFRINQEVDGFDDGLQKEGSFIYLNGVASTVVGSLVTYAANQGTTTLAPATGGIGQVAVAMAAIVLGKFGWYQVRGLAAVKCPNSVAIDADVFALAATPGSVDDAVVASEQILNAKFASDTGSPASGLAYVQIDHPFFQGRIT
jgi:hypothetical protein